MKEDTKTQQVPVNSIIIANGLQSVFEEKTVQLALSCRSTINRTLNRQKVNERPTLPPIVDRHFEVPKQHEDFCVFDSGIEDPERLLIFGDRDNIQSLFCAHAKSRLWFKNKHVPSVETSNFETLPTNIVQMIPGKIAQTTKDGNCLFSTFSYLLTNSQQSSNYIRNIIFDQLNKVPFTTDQLNANTDRQNETRLSYITSSKMWKSGEWGGDIEVAAFSFILQTKIFVYSDIGVLKFNYIQFNTVHFNN